MLNKLTGGSEVLVRSLLECVRKPLHFYFYIYWEIVDGFILVVCHASNPRLPSSVKLRQHRPRTLMRCAMFSTQITHIWSATTSPSGKCAGIFTTPVSDIFSLRELHPVKRQKKWKCTLSSSTEALAVCPNLPSK